MNGVRLKFSHDKSSNNNYLYNIFSYTDGSIKLKWFDRKGSLNDWARMNEIGIVLCRPSVHSFHAAQRKPTLPTDRAIQTCSAHRHRKLGSLLHDGFVWQPARAAHKSTLDQRAPSALSGLAAAAARATTQPLMATCSRAQLPPPPAAILAAGLAGPGSPPIPPARFPSRLASAAKS